MAEAILAARNLVKRFGGLVATDGVTLAVEPNEIHALIGPNGAGKTTLIGELAGEIEADGGRILFEGRDITALPVERRSRLGLSRSFQITSLFLDMTAIDNVALAVQIRQGHSFRFWRGVGTDASVRNPARDALERVNLADRADALAGNMSHGEHRRLEIAIALASQPRMLLLDEPMAGLGPDEGRHMVELLRGLKGYYTILLVEHDMDAVFALADRITVLVYGRVIATGRPRDIRANEEVRHAYLGTAETAP